MKVSSSKVLYGTKKDKKVSCKKKTMQSGLYVQYTLDRMDCIITFVTGSVDILYNLVFFVIICSCSHPCVRTGSDYRTCAVFYDFPRRTGVAAAVEVLS